MWCYFYIIFYSLHCPLSGPDLTYISLLIIPCIIYYVTNKETLNLEVCFATRSDTAVKSVFLSACLRSGGWAGPPLLRLMYIAETLINPLFPNVAFRRDSVRDG